MGNTMTRLIAEKQRVLRQALEELDLGLTETQVREVSLKLMGRLNDRGYQVRMLGGDRVWDKDEEPPDAEEILTWASVGVPPQTEQEVLIAHLRNQLRNSEIFRRNVIHENRMTRREIGQLLETWDNLRDFPSSILWLMRVKRRVEDLRQFAPGVLREDEDGAPYPEEVQE